MKGHLSTLALAITLAASSFSALAKDVTGRAKDNDFIRVTLNADKTGAKFELCRIANPKLCLPIGKKVNGKSVFYMISDLQDQRENELWQIAGAIAADGVLGLTFLSGVEFLLTGYAAAGTGEVLVEGVFDVSGMGTQVKGLALASGSLLAVGKAVNPVEQYRQYKVLSNEIVLDKKVNLNGSIYDYAASLDIVLNKLDPL